MTDDYGLPKHPAVTVDLGSFNPTFRTADLRVLRDILGRSPAQILQDDDADELDKNQILAFLQLRKEYPDVPATPLWAVADETDVTITGVAGMAPGNPTNGVTGTTLQPSAGIGV
jgi:hypothetical protein